MTTVAESTLSTLTTIQLTNLFESGSLPEAPFTHRDHVRVAWQLLERYDLGLALDRMTQGVKVLAKQRGLPDLFHATITTFYMLAIADRISRSSPQLDFDSFALEHESLVSPSRRFLLGFYFAETLDSARARHGFLLPDRVPTVV